MIAPAYVATMAAYNAELNRRVYAAASRLPEATRRQGQGAFWSSIHGTLSHLLWADHQWMSRLADWPKPAVALAASGSWVEDFAGLQASRFETDRRLVAWAAGIDPVWLAGSLTWFSGATRQQQTRPRSLIVVHVFNHQTHHRGQIHAMLTRAGEDTGATDLPFVLDA